MKMNRKRLLLSAVIAVSALAGCELLVDFDRTQIPGDVTGTDGGPVDVPDASVVDDAGDGGDAASETDGSAVVDASTDAPIDSGTDSGTDAGSDASADAGDGGDGGG